MKKNIKNTAKHLAEKSALQQLGGLTAEIFLRDYWQKKPLLIRQAFPGFVAPLTKPEVLELAQREEAESRLISQKNSTWQLQEGPLARRDFAAMKNHLWTVLVQDTQHFSHEAHALLQNFNFIPNARVDDLMVSYAVAGAGVGAHVDSYDVFLLQGMGSRRWQISSQTDHAMKQDVPLKILARFNPEHEYLLENGDMLYLPPGYAHHGVAETECLTWSIGFRAPSQQELGIAMLDFLRDEINLDGQYRDADLTPVERPGEVDAAMRKRMNAMLNDVRAAMDDGETLQRFLGNYLTEPKSHVYFDPPDPELKQAAFARKIGKAGIQLDLKSRLLYLDEAFFMNGEQLDVGPAEVECMRTLADTRRLPAPNQTASLARVLFPAYRSGFIEFAGN